MDGATETSNEVLKRHGEAVAAMKQNLEVERRLLARSMDQKISHEKRLNDDASVRSSKAWAAHVKAQEARIAKHREEHEVALEQIAQTFSKSESPSRKNLERK